MPAEMTMPRFPSPWSIEQHPECFIVRDAKGQALGYFYFDEEPHRRTVNQRMTKSEARRMAANFARLPRILASLAYAELMPRGLIGFLTERPVALRFILLLICLLLVAIGFLLFG
jgi:hypothetical protein